MSTVVTENLKRATEAVSRSLRGVAAAWVSFNGTGTAAIRDSQNVSSLSDNGVGTFTFGVTSAFSAAAFDMAGAAGGALASSLVSPYTAVFNSTASVFAVNHYENAAAADSSVLAGTMFGDLA